MKTPLSFSEWCSENDIEEKYQQFHDEYGDAACLLSEYKERHYNDYLEQFDNKSKMKKHALIRLTKDRVCYFTKIFLPKNSVLYAEHVIKDVWHITNSNVSLSVIEYEDFDFMNE